MENVLFSQSEVADPYMFYARMRDNHPIYYDESNSIWAVYTYTACERILQLGQSKISAPNSLANKNIELQSVLCKLARLSNGASHTKARASAIHLMSCWRSCAVPFLLHNLMGEPRLPATIDWVEHVAKRLPAFALLKGFDFSTSCALSLLPEIENLVKLMAPVYSNHQVESILKSLYIFEEAFNANFSGKLPTTKGSDLYLANFIGLLIQTYDATRGLLSNALVNFVKFPALRPTTQNAFAQFVREANRLDPAVHNTRRTMQHDLMVENCKIKGGDQVLIVLASANRDSSRFLNPDSFILDRKNDPLSFGLGIHKCIADHFAIELAASLLHYLNTKYSKFEIQEREIHYESRINVRLPKKITLVTS